MAASISDAGLLRMHAASLVLVIALLFHCTCYTYPIWVLTAGCFAPRRQPPRAAAPAVCVETKSPYERSTYCTR